MSNRDKVVDPETGKVKKVYIPRAERRARRNARRIAAGAPPEVPVHGNSKKFKDLKAKVDVPHASYLGVVQQVDPETGEDVGEPVVAAAEGRSSTAFLIDGVKYVYDGLGGAKGFLEWAKEHPTKFRELAMKLIPAQVSMIEKGIGVDIVIQHALPPPNYNPSGKPVNTIPGEVAVKPEPPRKVDIDALREALAALPAEERKKLLEAE